MTDLLRVYLDPAEIGPDGYPLAWRKGDLLPNDEGTLGHLPIKDLIRERDGHRCLRCGHPYRKGENGNGEWSPCDENCTHGAPIALIEQNVYGQCLELGGPVVPFAHETLGRTAAEVFAAPTVNEMGLMVLAQWRILTVHHLNGVKHDCRWWNLVSLCQRCHLTIQGRVIMEREYDRPHSDWFKPFAAGFYAAHYLGEDLDQAQTEARLEELLSLQLRQEPLF